MGAGWPLFHSLLLHIPLIQFFRIETYSGPYVFAWDCPGPNLFIYGVWFYVELLCQFWHFDSGGKAPYPVGDAEWSNRCSGLHNLRYHDLKLDIFPKWNNIYFVSMNTQPSVTPVEPFPTSITWALPPEPSVWYGNFVATPPVPDSDPTVVTKPCDEEAVIEPRKTSMNRRLGSGYYRPRIRIKKTADGPVVVKSYYPSITELVTATPVSNSSISVSTLERNIRGSHLASDLDPDKLRKRIALAGRALAGYDFDSIAFRGVSGTILGAPIALLMNKEMVLVRKDGDDTHSGYRVEGNRNVLRYIIVDDFVSSGHTGREIVRKIEAFAPGAECLGLLQTRYLYEDEVAEAEQTRGAQLELTPVKLPTDTEEPVY